MYMHMKKGLVRHQRVLQADVLVRSVAAIMAGVADCRPQ
jgi:hypothetical protein